tara:strand:+ start:490 stop:855 length:366 start_codon:yes stop_codon:yes gene_type:complete
MRHTESTPGSIAYVQQQRPVPFLYPDRSTGTANFTSPNFEDWGDGEKESHLWESGQLETGTRVVCIHKAIKGGGSIWMVADINSEHNGQWFVLNVWFVDEVAGSYVNPSPFANHSMLALSS